MKQEPSQTVINAFGVKGKAELLPGGQQTSYRVENIVLKPTNNTEESIWIAETLNNITENEVFRITKSVKSGEGLWVVDGWTASKFVEGEHRTDKWPEVIKISHAFHSALKSVPCPPFLKENTNPWAIADRMAWQEKELPHHPLTEEAFSTIKERLKKVTIPSQIIHGDIGENILFHNSLPPAVIDFCPYWRPAAFAIAIGVIDAFVWREQTDELLQLCKDIEQFDQLLLRAFLRRVCEQLEHQRQSSKDPTKDINQHLSILDRIMKFNNDYQN